VIDYEDPRIAHLRPTEMIHKAQRFAIGTYDAAPWLGDVRVYLQLYCADRWIIIGDASSAHWYLDKSGHWTHHVPIQSTNSWPTWTAALDFFAEWVLQHTPKEKI